MEKYRIISGVLGVSALFTLSISANSAHACSGEAGSTECQTSASVKLKEKTPAVEVEPVQLVSELEQVLGVEPAASSEEAFSVAPLVTVAESPAQARADAPLNSFGGALVVAIDENGNRVKPTAEQIEAAQKSRLASKRPQGKPLLTVYEQADGTQLKRLTNIPVYGVYARKTAEGNLEAACFVEPEQAEAWMQEATLAVSTEQPKEATE